MSKNWSPFGPYGQSNVGMSVNDFIQAMDYADRRREAKDRKKEEAEKKSKDKDKKKEGLNPGELFVLITCVLMPTVIVTYTWAIVYMVSHIAK